MMEILLAVVGFLSGGCASLGIGGGFVLLLYLSAVLNMPQREGQLINLLFFLPIAAFSLLFHAKHKLIDQRKVLPWVIGGLLGVFPGVFVTTFLQNRPLSKLFAAFLLIVGFRELFFKKSKKDPPHAK